MITYSPLTRIPALSALSSQAILSVDGVSTDPNPSTGAPDLLFRDLWTIKRSAEIARRSLQRTAGDDEAVLADLLTTTCERIRVSFWPAMAEIVAERVANIQINAYCRKIAWLYGRQLELLDRIEQAAASSDGGRPPQVAQLG